MTRHDLKVGMWSTTYPAPVEDVYWILTELGCYIASNEDYFVFAKERFTPEEASEAAHDYNRRMVEWEYEPQVIPPESWTFNNLVYIVVENGNYPQMLTVTNLADADVDWVSMDEFFEVQRLKMDEEYRSKDGYLYIRRILQ
jgi:hypothetical protein